MVMNGVKSLVLTAVGITGFGPCKTANGFCTALSSLLTKEASGVPAVSGPLSGAGEKR